LSPKVTESHKEQRRSEILQAAESVFIRKGYESATMQDIIEESGMSRGGVYLYFSSKEEIFRALIERIHESHLEGFQQLVMQTKSSWEAIETFLQIQEKETLDVGNSLAPAIYEFFLTTRDDIAMKEYNAQRYHGALEQITNFLEAGVERGEFKPVISLESIGRLIVPYLDGLLLEAFFVDLGEDNIKAHIDALRDYLKMALQVDQAERPWKREYYANQN
jgi:AcrR family transcriptional regulator